MAKAPARRGVQESRNDSAASAQAGSKLDKAQKLGVQIIDEAERLRLCGG
jgi:NAD-dependent DNA ligase